jgi:tRNA A-37 threonylcarbamoyl transferase component Bud32
MVAAVVMEAAAREWVSMEEEEAFPAYLVRREVLRGEQIEELAAAVASEPEGAPGEAVPSGGEVARAPHPSEVIKGYRILERLGRGGMGSVYRAEQIGMNRIVALKILRRPLGDSPEHVERLRREARIVGALDHPNIVRGLDVGQHGPYHYFAMEFVEGETLRDALKRRGVIPEAEALRLVEQVCLALDHAHARGIVHRDVKPGNIIVTPDGTPKLTDYGLAKGPADFTLTQSGVTVGTPQYISPDQAQDPSGVDIQTDIYSLGATAYNMLAGIPPHASDTLAGLLTKVLYEKPRTARQVNPRVSPGASFLVEKMMAKQKRHRYREPREVLRDLRALAAGKSIVPRNWAGDFEVHEARRQKRWYAAGAAAVVLLALGGTVYLQYESAKEKQKLLDETSGSALRAIVETVNPRTRDGWDERLRRLEEFLNRREFRDTDAHREADRARDDAQAYFNVWLKADAINSDARKPESERKYRKSLDCMRDAIVSLSKGAEQRLTREPIQWLHLMEKEIQESGRIAAEEEAHRHMDLAAKVALVPGQTAKLIQDDFQATLDVLRADYYEGPDPMAVEDLEKIVRLLRRTRSSFEESRLGPAFRESQDLALKSHDYATLEEALNGVRKAIEEDGGLQTDLQQLPVRAAEDFRGRIDAEMDGALKANGAWLDAVEANARKGAAAGDFDGALAGLEQAEAHSMAALRERVARTLKEIEDLKSGVEAAFQRQVADFLEAFRLALAARDFAGARFLAAGTGGAPGAVEGARMKAARDAADLVLRCIEEWAFMAVRRRIAEKGDFHELQFDEPGNHQLYIQAANVRLQETETGSVVVFDDQGQPGRKGSLYKMSLDLLLRYAELKGPGLSAPQALARAALTVAGGESLDLPRLYEEARYLGIIRDGGSLPKATPVIDMLLQRVGVLISARIAVEQDKEKEAADSFERIRLALDARDPRTAQRELDILSQSLGRTRFFEDHKDQVAQYQKDVWRLMKELRLGGLFPGARIDDLPAGAGSDSLTRITYDFDDELQSMSFVPPEDGGRALYQIALDPAGPDGGPRNGRLVFLQGAEPRNLAESPLTLECPFKPRAVAVQLTYRSDAPFYFEVDILGNHVGVLTDDGQRTGGRGVYAWQGDDWHNPDRAFPPSYRHDFLPKVDLSKVKEPAGWKYFQFEPGVTYLVRVEWDRGRIRFIVDGREIWNFKGNAYMRDSPPRIRILSFTRGWIDDLIVEGVEDLQHVEELKKELKKK